MIRAALLCAAALLVVGVYATPAVPHEWYPHACCSNRDCFEVGTQDVLATAGGWRIKSSGEVILFGDARIHQTPPEGGNAFHVCYFMADPTKRALCLFVPDMGA